MVGSIKVDSDPTALKAPTDGIIRNASPPLLSLLVKIEQKGDKKTMMMLIELIPKFQSSSQRGSIYLAKRSSANARGGGGGSRRRGGALGWGVRVLDPH